MDFTNYSSEVAVRGKKGTGEPGSWYAKNREHALRRAKERHEEMKADPVRWQAHLKKRREEYHRNRARWRDKAAKRYRKNKQQIRARQREYYFANRDRILAREKARYRERLYGLTHEQYVAMVKKQNGVCAICGRRSKGGRALDVDHCHDTDRIRGLLCNGCNTALGTLSTPELLDRAKEYLAHPPNG